MDKYKNPQWQRKRLQILERDNWSCTVCGSDKKQLHVHHRYYIQGRNVWEYDNDSLTTLCDSCHEYEHKRDVLSTTSEQRHPKYEMLNRNLDFVEIPAGLTMFQKSGTPKRAKELNEYVQRICDEYPDAETFFSAFITATATMIENPSTINDCDAFSYHFKQLFNGVRDNGE